MNITLTVALESTAGLTQGFVDFEMGIRSKTFDLVDVRVRNLFAQIYNLNDELGFNPSNNFTFDATVSPLTSKGVDLFDFEIQDSFDFLDFLKTQIESNLKLTAGFSDLHPYILGANFSIDDFRRILPLMSGGQNFLDSRSDLLSNFDKINMAQLSLMPNLLFNVEVYSRMRMLVFGLLDFGIDLVDYVDSGFRVNEQGEFERLVIGRFCGDVLNSIDPRIGDQVGVPKVVSQCFEYVFKLPR